MSTLRHTPDYKIGDQVEFISRNDYGSMRNGDIVTVIDIREGIFPSEEYAVVETPKGRTFVAHTWRFKKYEEEENATLHA